MNSALSDLAAAWPRDLLGVTLVVFDEVDSTQRIARALLDRQLAEGETPPPCCVVALAQSQGRGRRGRSWQSAPGLGVWATLLLPVEPDALPSVPLRTATALAETLGREVDGVRLKWPNDLVVDGRKLGGLLVESVVRDGSPAWALVGFGLNVRHERDELPTPEATSLRCLGLADERCELRRWIPDLAGAVAAELGEYDAGWLDRYRALSAHRVGDPLTCDLDGERISGALVGLDPDGALRLGCADGERRITSGDLYAW